MLKKVFSYKIAIRSLFLASQNMLSSLFLLQSSTIQTMQLLILDICDVSVREGTSISANHRQMLDLLCEIN